MLRKTSLSSGEVLVASSPVVIFAGPCYLAAVSIKTDGTNPATVIAYDNATEASGAKRFQNTVVGANHYGGRNWTFPVLCVNGITISLTGTLCSSIVEYIPVV